MLCYNYTASLYLFRQNIQSKMILKHMEYELGYLPLQSHATSPTSLCRFWKMMVVDIHFASVLWYQ